jgi:hypothetical protein
MSANVGTSTSRNPKGLHGLYRDNFTFYISMYADYLEFFFQFVSCKNAKITLNGERNNKKRIVEEMKTHDCAVQSIYSE